MKKLVTAVAALAAGTTILAGCWGCSEVDDASTKTPTVAAATPSTTADPTLAAASTPAPLAPAVAEAIVKWVATEQNSEYVGPCPSGDPTRDTTGKWCHLPPREAEANRIVIWVGAVASGNVWQLVLERGAGDAWEVVSAEKVRGT